MTERVAQVIGTTVGQGKWVARSAQDFNERHRVSAKFVAAGRGVGEKAAAAAGYVGGHEVCSSLDQTLHISAAWRKILG